MTTVPASLVKELREKTGAGVMDCKEALAEAQGNLGKAVELLRAKGVQAAAQKAGRGAAEGLVVSYIHGGGRIGVLVELNCETDFVARTEKFASLAKEIALQVAASNPTYVCREDVPAEVIEEEKAILRMRPDCQGRPPAVVDTIVSEHLEKFFEETCLLDQTYNKNPDLKVTDLLTEAVATFGENVVVRRFCRYRVGEGKPS